MLKLFHFKKESFFERIVKKDKSVFADLHERYAGQTYAFILENGGTKNEAEETFLNTLVLLWECIQHKQIIREEDISPFLEGIGKYLWAKQTENTVLLMELDDPMISKIDDSSRLFADMLGSDEFKSVMASFNEMSLTSQKILTLFYWDLANYEVLSKRMKLGSPAFAKQKKEGSVLALLEKIGVQ